ncbi:MAG TPA: hypothetical protein VGN83_15425 [Falsiroseomonas sp.]|nr:hypothetical protein [Falsiroseomonas sp.]
MTIIADRGLFVRLLVQSGRFEQDQAEALADSLDSASKDPATKLDVLEIKTEVTLLKSEFTAFRNEVRAEFAAVRSEAKSETSSLRNEMKAGDALLAQRMDGFQQALDAQTNKLLVRLGGLMIATAGLLFAALRLT